MIEPLPTHKAEIKSKACSKLSWRKYTKQETLQCIVYNCFDYDKTVSSWATSFQSHSKFANTFSFIFELRTHSFLLCKASYYVPALMSCPLVFVFTLLYFKWIQIDSNAFSSSAVSALTFLIIEIAYFQLCYIFFLFAFIDDCFTQTNVYFERWEKYFRQKLHQ